ncbi:MAG: hypothetical protein CMN58_03855 [Solibacterales bacterium]|nr:hypothetical protein [Bryobacterales bacterium]|tara:strand:+ start:32836 stop:36096 length:3261 start_codon:yes stop_codon:yes gene_type:complete
MFSFFHFLIRYLYIAAVVFTLGSALGQRSSSLSGTIFDPDGAAISGVELQLSNTSTGEEFVTSSNETGTYVFPVLPNGAYGLVARAEGFKTYSRPSLEISTGQSSRADFHMELGVFTEVVTVHGDVPQLRTEDSAVSATIRNETIANMPLIDRRVAQLVRLNGFMVQNGTASNFTMAGGRGFNAMWTLDGGIVQNVTLGTSELMFDPPIEAMEEFTVDVSNYKAEMGRSGGGVVRMTTRGGSNQLHGSLYEFVRNDAFDARNFFAADKPTLRRNQFGISVGGPIKRNRTHFFLNMEAQRQDREQTRILNVPEAAEVGGQFSKTILDPATFIGAERSTGTPFPNSIIPASRFDSVGTQLSMLYPLPNVPGAKSRRLNYRTNQPISNDMLHLVSRIDHVVGNNDRILGRFIARDDLEIDSPVFTVSGVDSFHRTLDGSYFNSSLTWFHNFSSKIIMETRFTWVRRKFIRRSGGADQGWPEKLGLQGVNKRFFPRVRVTGLTQLGENVHERRQEPIRTNMWVQHFTQRKSNHTLKYGYEFRMGSNDDVFLGSGGGRFVFNPNATGDALASLILGHTVSGSREESLVIRSRANSYAAFFQDDWKVSPNLTLNLGLRWDMDQPRWEELGNRQNSFSRTALNPVCDCPGLVTFSGRNGLSKYAHNFDKNNFGPRVGFSWRLDEKTVIRGGGAVLYAGEYDQATPRVAFLGFGAVGQFSSPDGGITPAFRLQDGLPYIPEPIEADLIDGFGAIPVGGGATTRVDFFEPNNRGTPYLWSANFNIQRQLPGDILFEVGYIATLGHKLANPGFRNINVVPLETLAAKNGNVTQQDRLFPQFGDVRVAAAAIGNSNYHGVNFKLHKRFSSGFHFRLNYTWSKLIDDVEARSELGGNFGNSAFSNFFDRASDRGLSGNHIAHRFIWSSVYEIPFQFNYGLLDQFFGGWSVGLIAEFRSGSPFGIVENNAAGVVRFAPVVRSDAIAPYSSNSTWRDDVLGTSFFDATAFTRPVRGQFGNLGRTVAIGPAAAMVDLSLLKNFSFSEGHRLQFRIEILNMPNHPNFNLPEQRRGRGNFGRISSLIPGNQARIIQFGLHYKF